MRPGSGLKVAGDEEEQEEKGEEGVMVVDSIEGPHKAWGCVIY